MSAMGAPYTVIMTQFVTAEELKDELLSMPMFIEDGIEAAEPGTGIRTSLARMVTAVHFGPIDGEIVVDFADGSSSRTFDSNAILEIRRIIPGKDLIELANGDV